MKRKLLYLSICVFALSSILIIGLKSKVSKITMHDVQGEIQLLSSEIVDHEQEDLDTVVANLVTLIAEQKSLLDLNVQTIETLKTYIDTNEIEISRKDLIYIKLSIEEIKIYRRLYIKTYILMEDEIIAMNGPYEMLTDEEKVDIDQAITDMITYRLVLLEKINLELRLVIDMINIYEGGI